MSAPMTLPDSIRYSKGLKDLPPGIQVSRQDYLAEGAGSFSTSNRIIRIPINGGSNTFLDTNRCALQFDLTVTAAASQTVICDGSAYGIFEQARVLSANGMVLEQVSNYGNTVNSLLYSEMTNDFYASNARNFLFPGGAAGVTGGNACLQTTAATGGFVVAAGAGAAVTGTGTASLPLLGLGTMNLSSNAHNGGLLFPLALTKGIILELTLKSSVADMFVATAANAASNFSISNVKYRATIVTMPDSIVMPMKQAILASGGKLPVSSYTYNVQSFNVGNGNVTLQAGQRAKSIKSVYIFPREAGNAGNVQRFKFTAAQQNPSKFQLLIGNKQYPEVFPTNATEALEEYREAMGGKLGALIPAASYFKTDNTTNFVDAQIPALGYLGFDLESVGGKEWLQNGWDNSTNSLPVQVVLNSAYANARTIDVAMLIDQILIFDVNTGAIEVSY